MINLWRAFKLVLPHRGMLALYLCTALGLAICGSAPLILAHTFINHLESAGKAPKKPQPAPPVAAPADDENDDDPEIKDPKRAAKDAVGVKSRISGMSKGWNDWLQGHFGTGRDYVIALCVLILIFWVLKATFDFLNTYIGSWLAQRLRTEAIERVMGKLLSLDMPFFD